MGTGELPGTGDPCRPTYHYSSGGWMNDVIPYWDGRRLHVYFNHHKEPRWGRFRWGHACTDDLVSWATGPFAIVPTRDGRPGRSVVGVGGRHRRRRGRALHGRRQLRALHPGAVPGAVGRRRRDLGQAPRAGARRAARRVRGVLARPVRLARRRPLAPPRRLGPARRQGGGRPGVRVERPRRVAVHRAAVRGRRRGAAPRGRVPGAVPARRAPRADDVVGRDPGPGG